MEVEKKVEWVGRRRDGTGEPRREDQREIDRLMVNEPVALEGMTRLCPSLGVCAQERRRARERGRRGRGRGRGRTGTLDRTGRLVNKFGLTTELRDSSISIHFRIAQSSLPRRFSSSPYCLLPTIEHSLTHELAVHCYVHAFLSPPARRELELFVFKFEISRSSSILTWEANPGA